MTNPEYNPGTRLAEMPGENATVHVATAKPRILSSETETGTPILCAPRCETAVSDFILDSAADKKLEAGLI